MFDIGTRVDAGEVGMGGTGGTGGDRVAFGSALCEADRLEDIFRASFENVPFFCSGEGGETATVAFGAGSDWATDCGRFAGVGITTPPRRNASREKVGARRSENSTAGKPGMAVEGWVGPNPGTSSSSRSPQSPRVVFGRGNGGAPCWLRERDTDTRLVTDPELSDCEACDRRRCKPAGRVANPPVASASSSRESVGSQTVFAQATLWSLRPRRGRALGTDGPPPSEALAEWDALRGGRELRRAFSSISTWRRSGDETRTVLLRSIGRGSSSL